MKLRLWPRRRAGPAGEEPAPEPKAEAEPEPGPEPPPPAEREGEQKARARAHPRKPASAFARPYAPGGETAPALPTERPPTLSLTIEEARAAIRASGGDVMQVGFLARAYQRQRAEEPESAETAAARRRLTDLVAKRLKDRKLLDPEGRFELLDDPSPPAGGD